MGQPIEDYVRSLGLDAYVVGGAVRDALLGLESADADFLVPGVDDAGLRALLEPHGKLEDLEVAGRRVGVRLYPRGRGGRQLAPAGIEFAPPRAERSTGPGRHDFVIVADGSISVEEDLGRRDFTINAIARRLEDGALVDPYGGRKDLEQRTLRSVGPRSFAEDPLRLLRGLRLVSQLDLDPDAETLTQMHDEAPSVALVSGERIGGGVRTEGLGELSKLLLGVRPAKALRLARDTGVLTQVLPEFEPAIGYEQRSERQHLPLDEHIFAVVQAAADDHATLAVRLAALLHDLGKPASEAGGGAHAKLGAGLARTILIRLRYPRKLQSHVVALVESHAFPLDGPIDELRARRFLRRHGKTLALDLIAHKRADLRGKRAPSTETLALGRLQELVEGEGESAYRLEDLALDGDDLIALGFSEGPALGRALESLLDAVVEEPELNRKETLELRARALLLEASE